LNLFDISSSKSELYSLKTKLDILLLLS